MIKKLGKLCLAAFMAITTALLTGCGGESGGENQNVTPPAVTKSEKKVVSFGDEFKKEDTWLVYWYLCGTDLESNNGAATLDLNELVQTNLPPNVKVLIQTGGTVNWQNELVPNGAIGRFLYDAEDFKPLETLPDADMANESTLEDFIRYGKDNFQADHRVFIFWDHGGGSAVGICYDERTGHALSLNDLNKAFANVYGENPDNPPFELIGFDACLMATYDVASSIYGFSKYMVGSEEVEPGNGWNYTGWVGALAKNPAMSGALLGKAICDSYMEGCRQYRTADAATLSLIDLSQVPALSVAYEYFGYEALQNARKDARGFFSTFGRGAQRAENYGGNTRRSGFSNMVDLGDLARQSKSLLPSTSGDLISAIDDAVIYKVNGGYRTKGSGLSGFYSYDGSEQALVSYINVDAAPTTQKLLYYYLIYGELPDNAVKAIDSGSFEKDLKAAKAQIDAAKPAPQIEEVPVTSTPPAQRENLFTVESLEDFPVQVDKDGNAFVKLTPEQMEILSSVRCELVYISVEDDIVLFLGSDANVDANWETGIFKDNFSAVWPTLDGHLVYMEITAETDEYNLYDVPIKLNGVECNLQVAYTFDDNAYHILGARKAIDDNGMADRELVKLKAGDQITTVHYGKLISNDDEFIPVDNETFTLDSDSPVFKDEETGDGLFGYFFEFVTPTDDSALSTMIQFNVENGQITTTSAE